MSAADPVTRLMTAEEFMALPDDGRERWLLDGQVYTLEDSMTVRNWVHSGVVTNVAFALKGWLRTQPLPRGRIATGDGGFRLRRDPDILVGADVAYASAALVAATPRKQPYYDGPPTLAVEVLSPSDKHEDVVAKVEAYLQSGSVVWVVDPDFRIVMVHRPDHPARSYSIGDELSADPYLPGFRVAVADLFED
ncbi:Uma2 family endonuclease [Tundrisphaera sp. TA3]|uniref:Uma2 family endonuclease n=1 Tax=Tundrisphaera sp. TA3 TaxID=3435775 RepID=UPI003EBDBC81